MKQGTIVINTQSNKEAVFIKQDATHTTIKIDGIETPLANNLFKKLYKEKV